MLHIVMFSFSVVFDRLQKVSVTPLKSFDSRLIEPMNGEGKRRNELVGWHVRHVAWLAE